MNDIRGQTKDAGKHGNEQNGFATKCMSAAVANEIASWSHCVRVLCCEWYIYALPITTSSAIDM